MSRRLALLLACFSVLPLGLAACGEDGSDSAVRPVAESPPPAQPDPPPPPEPTGTTIKLADSDFGRILFNGEDRAIYLFDAETTPEPACYGPCAQAWPPVLTEAEPRAAGGVKQKLLGTSKRRDGSLQVTYNGHPLYYYDEPPGVVSCHDVFEFGGTWLVVDASGDPV